jgi:hypothetical protein
MARPAVGTLLVLLLAVNVTAQDIDCTSGGSYGIRRGTLDYLLMDHTDTFTLVTDSCARFPCPSARALPALALTSSSPRSHREARRHNCGVRHVRQRL